MSDDEWAHVLLMKLKKLKGCQARQRAVVSAFARVRESEERRTYHAIREAVLTLDRQPAEVDGEPPARAAHPQEEEPQRR